MNTTPIKPTHPACNTCKHLVLFSYPPSCKAFPKGIPDCVLDCDDDHRLPVRGDNGVQWEKV